MGMFLYSYCPLYNYVCLQDSVHTIDRFCSIQCFYRYKSVWDLQVKSTHFWPPPPSTVFNTILASAISVSPSENFALAHVRTYNICTMGNLKPRATCTLTKCMKFLSFWIRAKLMRSFLERCMYFLNEDFNKHGEKSEQCETSAKVRKIPYNKRLKISPLGLSENKITVLVIMYMWLQVEKSPSTKEFHLNKK